ncbi:MAG: septum formation protein Maf [Armatimonadetes bacterium]|nr:septum formation protein Maf [Armatimonadota bacterium]
MGKRNSPRRRASAARKPRAKRPPEPTKHPPWAKNRKRKVLYLASASPRRRELLALLGVPFVVEVSRFDEATLNHLTDPAGYVRKAARSKAREVASRFAGVILGCDTDVSAPDGTILGKPRDADDAKQMLRTLSGKSHSVYSAVALMESDGETVTREAVRVIETRVTFDTLSEAAINAYVATGDPLDKAGAYGIQSGGLAFVTRIEGDLSSVIGLPLPTVRELLTAFGVALYTGVANPCPP